MLQAVDGKIVYVVDLYTMPELPITGNGWERPYADALTQALVQKVIKEPGKYGISIDFTKTPLHWDVFKIIE
jgi:hypothetical protein